LLRCPGEMVSELRNRLRRGPLEVMTLSYHRM
jgi:hypothetical protein